MTKVSLTIDISPAMREALQIKTPNGVDYFMLLGLNREVNDVQSIDTAILDRSKSLRKWQSSPQHGAEAVKLLTVVHRAGKILKDPTRRAAYHQELERQERGEGLDAHDEFRDLVRAAMADSALDAVARKELMRFASEHNLGQADAQQIVAQVREELSAAKAAEVAMKPQEDSAWEFRIAEEGEEGFLLTLSGIEQNVGEFTEVSLASLMMQAAKHNVPPERAAALLAEFQKTRFKKMVKRVAAGGVISEAQVRLLLPKSAAYGLDQRQAYDLIADYTLSARSTEDALRSLAYAQTFSDEDINSIVENRPAARKRRSLFSLNTLFPDWLRNLVLIGVACAALVFLVIWLKNSFHPPAPQTTAKVIATVGTSGTANVPTVPVSGAPDATPAAVTPTASPETMPRISLDLQPDPPSGMLAFKPENQDDPPAFEMGITEVTCAQYQDYLKATLEAAPPGWIGPSNKPVTNVTWAKAMAYCDWLAARQGWPPRSVTLPSQAEYLRVALRGRTTKGYLHEVKDFWKRARLGTGGDPAAIKQNPLDQIFMGYGQMYDLVGNVAEWGRDAQGEQRAVLGGDTHQTAPDFNPMAQRWEQATKASPDIGFRIVHSLAR